jgi:hypothetical protein
VRIKSKLHTSQKRFNIAKWIKRKFKIYNPSIEGRLRAFILEEALQC